MSCKGYIIKAICEDNLEKLKSICEQNPNCIDSSEYFFIAARENSLNCLEFIYDKNPSQIGGAVSPFLAAVRAGHLEVLKFIHKRDPEQINMRQGMVALNV